MKTNAGALSVAVGTAFGGSGHIGLALATKSAGGDPKKLKAVVFPAVAQGLAALYGGHIDLVANPHSSFAAPLKEGRVRVLAVAAPQRLTGEFAAVPTWKELGVDSAVEAFRAIAGPKGMGAPQVAYWEATLRKMAETPEWKQMLETRTWVDRFAGAEGCKAALKYQYDQMRAGLLELGMAKNGDMNIAILDDYADLVRTLDVLSEAGRPPGDDLERPHEGRRRPGRSA